MNRRRFMKQLGAVSCAPVIAPMNVWGVSTPEFLGDFLLYVQVDGGWDVTSYCDPKINVSPGEPINHWAAKQDVDVVGNLRFAPVANNADFFRDHYEKTLVINGVNARTNVHSAGANYSHTGSTSKGMPHLAALYAYEVGRHHVMPVMASSQFSSAGLIAPTALGPAALELINPNFWNPQSDEPYRYIPTDDLATIRAFRKQQASAIPSRAAAPTLLAKQQQQLLDYYRTTIADTRGFERFQNEFYELNEGRFAASSYTQTLKTALTAFKAGLGVAADVPIKGFDSHEDHDVQFEERITLLNEAIGCAWHYAEQLGIANRLVVVLSSDFGRAPRYNRQQGKDHWPYGSTIIMKKNVAWTNRVVGYTDEGHIGQPINAETLQVDRMNGVEIDPGHVMQALRRLLGVADSATAMQFALPINREIDFFRS